MRLSEFKMTYKKFKAIVAKHGGWLEGDTAYFPSVYQRQECEKELASSS